jgi:hypothetical protein
VFGFTFMVLNSIGKKKSYDKHWKEKNTKDKEIDDDYYEN